MKKFKHIFGCISGIGALIAAYFGQLPLLISLSLITCFLCWTNVAFVRTPVDGIIKRILVFGFSHFISKFFAMNFDISQKILMWVLCDIAFLLMNIVSLIIVFGDGDTY